MDVLQIYSCLSCEDFRETLGHLLSCSFFRGSEIGSSGRDSLPAKSDGEGNREEDL